MIKSGETRDNCLYLNQKPIVAALINNCSSENPMDLFNNFFIIALLNQMDSSNVRETIITVFHSLSNTVNIISIIRIISL